MVLKEIFNAPSHVGRRIATGALEPIGLGFRQAASTARGGNYEKGPLAYADAGIGCVLADPAQRLTRIRRRTRRVPQIVVWSPDRGLPKRETTSLREPRRKAASLLPETAITESGTGLALMDRLNPLPGSKSVPGGRLTSRREQESYHFDKPLEKP